MGIETPAEFCLIMFSGDYDKSMAALTLANGAAGQGLAVTVFFTFWGISLLRQERNLGRNWLENMFKLLMPLGIDRLGLSRLNFGGCGPRLLKKMIRQKKGQTATDLFEMAQDRKIRFVACEASLKLLGFQKNELINYQHLEISGVDSFLKTALDSKVVLFI